MKDTRVVNRRKAPFDVYIGRPGPWGNPFSHMAGTLAKFKVSSREEAVSRFREWFLAQPDLVERARRELRGKVLGCWCKPALCHGDVIAEIVDGLPSRILDAARGTVDDGLLCEMADLRITHPDLFRAGSVPRMKPLDCQGIPVDSTKGKVSQ